MNWLAYLKVQFSKKKQFANDIKNIVGFYPNDVFLFERAMVHKSALYDSKKNFERSNERLEFLGDAVLGLIIAEILFGKFPNADEGELTKLRSRIVSRQNLNQIATHIGIPKLVIAKLDKNSKSVSIYGNAFEALVGAIYLDRGLEQSKKYIKDLISRNIIDIDKIIAEDTNFKSRVIEWSQKEKIELTFEIVEESGEGRNKEFVAAIFIDGIKQTEGKEKSKKKAEQLAAEKFCNDRNI